GPQNDVTLKMPAFEWVHVQLHQQKGMISLSPPTICNSAKYPTLRLFFNHQLLANCPSGGAMPFLRPKPSDYVHHATDLYESRQNQKRTV
ncbi:hypothetical protein, partial [Klebsiella quasipneumoniae]|uniref:hypothetical protein n=1 Tax=Klebsiella quasipneumoniae TaxID=1463165 RepID=UPI001C54CD5A